MAPRLVVLVGYDGVQGLDLTGPLDVFGGAQRWIERSGSGDPGYRIVVASPDGGALRTTAGHDSRARHVVRRRAWADRHLGRPGW